MKCEICITLLAGLIATTPASAVDGVIEINQASAIAGGVTSADTPGFPVTLVAGASYRLTSDLAVNANDVEAIVDAPLDTLYSGLGTISLDLNGFSIRCKAYHGSRGETSGCDNPTRNGIAIQYVPNVTITNGGVTGFYFGINIETSGARIERIHAWNNTGFGISVQQGGTITNSVVESNAGGIFGNDALITDNVVKSNSSDGISTGVRSLVIHNFVSTNGGAGLSLGTTTGYRENTIAENNPNVAGGVNLGNNLCSIVLCP